MRKSLKHLDKYRIEESPAYLEFIRETTNYLGSFIIEIPELSKDKFKALLSIDDDECEHVSISVQTADRGLKIEELDYIKNLFFTEDETKSIVVLSTSVCVHLFHEIPEFKKLS